jgi:hypothetical protein
MVPQAGTHAQRPAETWGTAAAHVVAMLRAVVVVGALVVLVALVWGAGARAAETDPYYGWLSPPDDGTAGLDIVINQKLEQGLALANALPLASSRSCREVSRTVMAPLWPTALFFFVSEMRTWDVPRSPESASEYVARMPQHGTYRHAPMLPFGSLVPVDPTLRVGAVLFGADKLGHFFTNGPRYLERWQAAKDEGKDDAAADVAAVSFGVEQENGVLGLGVSGVFSYADLEANWRGLEFFKGLCPETATTTDPAAQPGPRLLLVDGVWRLSRPFDITSFVEPCWDEAFANSAFAESEAAGVRQALVELCERWRQPDIADRWSRYRAVGCPAQHQLLLRAFIAAKQAPDPSPWSMDRVCPTSTMPPTSAVAR